MRILLAALALAQDTSVQEYEHPWAKFKEGSSVKTTVKMAMAGMNVESSQKQTLKSLNKDEAVLEIEMEIPAMGVQKREQKISLKGLPGSSEAKSKKLGDEELECDGQKFKCEIWEHTTADGVLKSWTCKDAKVCSKTLKSEQTGPGSAKTSMKVVKFSEKVKIGDKELDCSVAEIETETESQVGVVKLKGKVWQNADVPGFTVKSELKGGPEGMDMEVSNLVTEFEKK